MHTLDTVLCSPEYYGQTAFGTESIDMQAKIFNQPCIALSFFLSGANEIKDTHIELSNLRVILSRLLKRQTY